MNFKEIDELYEKYEDWNTAWYRKGRAKWAPLSFYEVCSIFKQSPLFADEKIEITKVQLLEAIRKMNSEHGHVPTELFAKELGFKS